MLAIDFADFTSGTAALTTIGVIAGAILLTLMARLAGRKAITRAIESTDPRSVERSQRLQTLWRVGRRLLYIAIWAVALLMIVAAWGVSIAPFLAVGTVVGLAVGFGGQQLVKDIIAGFFILIEDQFSIGDVVNLAGVSGTVEDIQLRVTVLRDLEGKRHYIPNGTIGVSTNLTQGFAKVVADIGVAYDSDVERAMAAISDEAALMGAEERWQSLFMEEPVLLGVNELADSAVIIRQVLTVAPDSRWDVRREFLRRVKARLDSEGIEIPYPHQTLVLKGESTRGDDPERIPLQRDP